ncbi:hypothetical protein FSZ17_03640 [Cytobacillus dafuensis]|uniref:Uncharacterized protein n=1 Tax=Cytobacillus dafuensis TaxID=1742359 RepID=A0A5B8ZAI3_CYTDA|nr:hypothetical protein FSZ17_03640 [Cytobacillus dafuensis]
MYRRLTGSKTPTSRFQENQRNLSGGSTARKGPIGSTIHQWGMKESPHRWKFHFIVINVD